MEIKDLLMSKEDLMKALNKMKNEGGELAKYAIAKGKELSGEAKQQYDIIALKAKIEKLKYDIGSRVVEIEFAKIAKDAKVKEMVEKVQKYKSEIATKEKETKKSTSSAKKTSTKKATQKKK